MIVGEIALELRGDQAALGDGLAGALGAGIARLSASTGSNTTIASAMRQPFLVAAERQDVDALFPGHLGGRAAERDERIGEARAVHVQGKPALPANRAEGRDLLAANRPCRIR